jgi:hypothetical protein
MNSFAAYKCALNGALSFGPRSKYIKFNNITSIDNGYGTGAMTARPAEADEYNGLGFEMKDSVIMGESEIPDCPSSTNGDYCEVRDKMGIFSYTTAHAGKVAHPTGTSALPLMKVKKDPCFGGKAIFNRVKFKDFASSTTALGKHNSILGIVEKSHFDDVPIHEFYDTTFENVNMDAIAYIKDPPAKWGNVKDCGKGFPCTAPKNVLFNF